MPADLKQPFGESCCDGGICEISKESARPCGCDFGAGHFCQNHEWKAKIAEIEQHFRQWADSVDSLVLGIAYLQCADHIREMIDGN